MKAGSNLEKVFEAGKFAVTAELGPPKSADVAFVTKRIGWLQGAVDAANITDNQTAIVRMSSIAAGRLCLEAGLAQSLVGVFRSPAETRAGLDAVIPADVGDGRAGGLPGARLLYCSPEGLEHGPPP